MLPSKVALLILCAMMFSNQVTVTGTCTMQQKETVLDDCKKFIKHGNQRPKPIPIMGQPCCNAVNKVPKKGHQY